MNKVEVSQRKESSPVFKKKFSFLELYGALIFVPVAILQLAANAKSKLIDKNFIERLQLAVTEVNGCPACSYQHTKIALRQGMSNEEIASFLSGGDNFIKPEEAKALMFVQHFAEAKGFPKKYAFEAVLKEYGKKQADIILSAAQLMIAGNFYGIPYSAFQSRIKGNSYSDSSIFYEIGMLLGGILALPLAITNGLIRYLITGSNRRLDSSLKDE